MEPWEEEGRVVSLRDDDDSRFFSGVHIWSSVEHDLLVMVVVGVMPARSVRRNSEEERETPVEWNVSDGGKCRRCGGSQHLQNEMLPF